MRLPSVAALKDHPPASKRVAIVGAGAVGLYAASELAKRGVQVVLVEAGGSFLGGFDPNSYASVGVRSDGLKLGRSRSLGGTTNLWGGQLVEFQPVDFEGRPWLANSKWPITYAQVAPYYPQTYTNLGIERETHSDDAVWASVSAKRPDMGPEIEAFLTRWLKTPNFATMYQAAIDTDPNLLLLTEHTLVGFDGAGPGAAPGAVGAIRVVDRDGNAHRIEADAFILANGTIEISRILLHAASDPAASNPGQTWRAPWRDNPLVGASFMDHLGGKIGVIQPSNSKAFFKTFCTIAKSGNKYQPKVRFKNDVLARESLYNIQGLFAFESSASEHLVYLKQFLRAAVRSRKVSGIGDLFKNAAGGFKYLVPLMWRYAWDHRVFVPSTSKIWFQMQGEHAPVRQSRITIDPSTRDAQGLPKVILDWRLAGDEQRSILAFAQRVDAAMKSAGYGTLAIEPALAAMDPAFMETLKDTYHQSGGTIMGVNDNDGVVDSDQRVFNTTNLYVAGSAVFRTVGNANTTMTALALTTRLVEHLSK